MQILLNNRADVNAQSGYYGNALQAATARRHEHMVTVLLESGANIDAEGGFYGTALQAALSSDIEPVRSARSECSSASVQMNQRVPQQSRDNDMGETRRQFVYIP